MFKLLSKESNIFSIPLYIGFLLLTVITFNVLNFNGLGLISAVVTFAGVSLGFFLFNKIDLNYQTHLPLFLYTFFIIGLYPGHLDIGIAVALCTNSFLLLLLTSTDTAIQNNTYLVVGAILAINFIFLPTTWPMMLFVIMHIIGTSRNIGLNLFRLIFGVLLLALSYFSIMYFFNFTHFDPKYIPRISTSLQQDFYPIYLLTIIFIMALLAVIDHFIHFNKKSPTSRFKYTFLLIFTLAQMLTVILYMGKSYEYLLLLAFPFSIILSRYLHFRPRFWLKELGLWVIIISLIAYKLGTYSNLNFLPL